MSRRLLLLISLAVLVPYGSAADAPAKPKYRSAGEIIAAAPDSAWRTPDPANLLYMELAAGRVIIELAPRFAPEHVGNIRTLARERFWDGTSIYRVQDNFVVQFGDAEADNPAKAKSLGSAKRHLPAEFHRKAAGVPFDLLPDRDGWAPQVGFVDGFPAARDPQRDRVWLAHCYGMVGAGRENAEDSSLGAELYVAIGQSPRQLDDNLTVVGKVLVGMELLSALKRGPPPMGMHENAADRTPIRSIRLASEVPPGERTSLRVLRTDTQTFRDATEARRNRVDDFYQRAAGHIDLCNVPVAVQATDPVPQPARIDVGGQAREYLLVTPATLPASPRPLVLVLHGHTGTAANALGSGRSPSPLSAWLDIAVREQIVVAALQGLKGSDDRTGWNDCRADADNNPASDDVAFANAVAQRLVAAGRVDPQRIYVTGMSNGAFMSLRLALQMQPMPAAVAPVAGTMALRSECPDTPRAVSVLLIHGTEDPLVPYGGGEVGLGNRRDRGGAQSVAATRDYWLRANGLLAAAPVPYSFPHAGKDRTRATRQTWGTDAGPQVQVITIEKGGHVEPSRRYDYPALYHLVVGPQNRDLETAEETWRFFRNKRAP